MLNRIHLLIILMIVLVSKMIAGDDSIAYDKIKKEVNVFKISNQKKFLNAEILRNIRILEKNENSLEFKELLVEYVKDLLDNGFFEEASLILSELDKLLIYNNEGELSNYYHIVGIYYRFLNNYDSALYYFNKAARLISELNDQELLGVINYSIGKTYQRKGDRDLALPYYLCANDLINNHIYALAQSKRRISSTYSLGGNNDLALTFINEALSLYVDSLGKNNLYQNEYANILQSRAYVYRQMAKGNNDSLNILYKSYQDAKQSIITFEESKRKLVFESDIVYSNTLYKYFYSKTIEAISRITDINQSDSLIYQALQFAEMDKSSALLRLVQKEIALSKSQMPDTTVQYLKHLYQNLSLVEAQRFEENANVRVNDTALYDLNMKLFDLVSEITELEKELEHTYPVYAKEKYKVKPPNLDFIIQQSYDKAILEYVMSNEKLYQFLVVDGEIHFKHFYYGSNFIENVERLQQLVADIKNIEYSLDELNEFEALSYSLYKDLIAPFDSLIGDRPLLIVPDEQLSLIPFEALLTQPNYSKTFNYSALPYLVKRNDISYAYSLTLSHKQKHMKRNYRHDALLAVAPTYDGLAGNQGSQYVALRKAFREARDELGMLEGAIKEAKYVSKRTKGVLYLDKKASEEQFKKHAPNYKVLHLAMHTLINNEDPLYSKLVFTPDVDVYEDGLLNTYELNNMELNAELVVLSACNTGFGKLNKGEGIIGLTRGFMLAGCKSLLATLWSVADQASADLINEFYNGLKKGNTKSNSLSEAKRKYIASTKGRNAHPFFWAAYISIGDDSPVKLKSNTSVYWYVSLFILLLVAVYLLMVQKKQ